MRKKTKFLLLRVGVILAFTVLAGRLWYVQIVMSSYYKQQADFSKIRLLPVPANRGIIYDRNGKTLVYNAPDWNVAIVPHGIPADQAMHIYRRLSQLLHGQPPARQIAKTVHDNMWRAYAPVIIKTHVSTASAMIIKQLHEQLPGVRADPSSVRNYVLDGQMSLSHILGYVGVISPDQYKVDSASYPRQNIGQTDLVGEAGVEAQVDPYLHGVNGTEEVEVDAGERPVRVLDPGHTVPGDSVYLTIDAKLQQAVSRDLAAGLHHIGLTRGVAIVENVHTGAILAMVSLPSYNNNWFAGGISQKRYNVLANDPAHPLIDMAIQGQFAPGSTYKVITATAALQTGVVNADTIIDDTGQIAFPDGKIFHGWKVGGLGPMNIVSALAESSDIYFYTVAGGNPNTGFAPYVGANRLAHYASLFGLGSPTGIDLPGEAPGFVPSAWWYNHLPANKNDPLRPSLAYTWHIGDSYNMGIGQGYNLATPLQMVNTYATIANGGTVYRPRIIKKIVGRVAPRRGVLRHAQVIEPFVPSIVRRDFIDPANLALIQTGLHDGVAWPGYVGTSYAVRDPRIDAAGKTGTAENPGTPHAWWAGYAPFHNPQVAVVVMAPNANAEGAYVAAPIAHKILEDYFHLPPLKKNWLVDVQQQLVGGGGSQ